MLLKDGERPKYPHHNDWRKLIQNPKPIDIKQDDSESSIHNSQICSQISKEPDDVS